MLLLYQIKVDFTGLEKIYVYIFWIVIGYFGFWRQVGWDVPLLYQIKVDSSWIPVWTQFWNPFWNHGFMDCDSMDGDTNICRL